MADVIYQCCRQRAGPLVKECRALMPRRHRLDAPYARQQKNQVLRAASESPVCHTPTDRLELRLALFGYEGVNYTLTFDDEHLPRTYRDVQAVWRRFLGRLRYWRGRPFDYVYCIEGRHGDRRYHIHMTVRYSDFPPLYMEELWGQGYVAERPLLLGPLDSYRRTARYYTKERSDGITIPISSHPWVASVSLRQQLPPLERWEDISDKIVIPEGVWGHGESGKRNQYGAYRYAWWIEADPRRCPKNGA